MNNYTETVQHQQAFDLIAHTNTSFFLTGKAGTGKTTFLKNVQRDVDKRFVVLAPTGVAALNAGGETIHSFFGLPTEAIPLGQTGKVGPERVSIIRHTDTFIIDEVSMVRCDIVDAIDEMLRTIMSLQVPFGGKQIVFVGDMLQLEPIVSNGTDRDILTQNYGNDKAFFFKAKALSKLPLPTIEFCKIFRQEDNEFKSILNEIRTGEISESSLNLLNQRLLPAPADELIITLSAHKTTVNGINDSCLKAIEQPLYSFIGEISNDFPDKNLPAPKELALKKGAQVMFTRNDSAKRWVNGTLGIVSELSQDKIHVKLENGIEHEVCKVTWERNKYQYDKKTKQVRKRIAGSYTQYPLTLAWAITIHKSQGLTFEKMILDLRRGIFSDGQLYVALSRVRSIRGLFLSTAIKPSYVRSNKDILRFSEGFNNETLINNEIERGKRLYDSMRNYDADAITAELKTIAYEEVQNGELKKSINSVSELFSHLVCDEHLFNPDLEYPNIEGDTLSEWFLKAFFSLYCCRFDEAIIWCNKIIDVHRCKEAYFLKARALAKIGKMNEADHVHTLLVKLLDNKVDDKIYYSVGCVNEEIGDPGLGILQNVFQRHPLYYPVVAAIQRYAYRRSISLPDNENPVIDAFNADQDGDSFIELYMTSDNEQREEFQKTLLKVAF